MPLSIVPGSQGTGRQRENRVERRHLEAPGRQPVQAFPDDPLVSGMHPDTQICAF